MNDARLEQRCVDALSFSRFQFVRIRGAHTHRRKNARGDVGDRTADLDRRTPRTFAGNRHQARHALRDEIEATVLAQRAAAAVP